MALTDPPIIRADGEGESPAPPPALPRRSRFRPERTYSSRAEGQHRCSVCDTLSVDELARLDEVLGNEALWPGDLFGSLPVPPGVRLPPSFRNWGAVRLGQEFFREVGKEPPNPISLRTHYRNHVPIVVLAGAQHNPLEDPMMVRLIGLYERTIDAAITSIEELTARVDDAEHPADTATLLEVVKIGARMATSLATIRSAGRHIGPAPDEGVDPFREAASGPVGPRIGNSRGRITDGEYRPVQDRGPADRSAYNKRAAEEGGPRLPAPS